MIFQFHLSSVPVADPMNIYLQSAQISIMRAEFKNWRTKFILRAPGSKSCGHLTLNSNSKRSKGRTASLMLGVEGRLDA